ncbi:MAG: 4-hydroxyphenylpyruvate dioxygenase [Bdellovibrio sp.]
MENKNQKPSAKNDLGLCGIDFVEFSSSKPQFLEDLFVAFGFSKLKKHKNMDIDYFKQNDIHFFVNKEHNSFAERFTNAHGACISSMGWRFKEPQSAYQKALSKGAKAAAGDFKKANGEKIPAIYGIGDSLIYFMGENSSKDGYQDLGFIPHMHPFLQPTKGFLAIDHLTNNVYNGTMQTWSDFYKNIFGFEEVRYFDIRGAKTGLTSYALRSPCGSFCIPINEAKESKSQINEYLEEYKGPGVQHLAFLTEDILSSLEALKGSPIETLDIDDDYYKDIFSKFPKVTEDHQRIKDFNVLVDGDDEGYLLQIFTKNIIGPIFIEIIQRKNHYSFGEGNFGALFRSIERDQMKRGVFT